MTIGQWLEKATNKLKDSGIESAFLDALILLEHITAQSRAQILSRPEAPISTIHIDKLNRLLEKRCLRQPIAYLTGSVEFYGRDFIIKPNVLVPRPESEAIIEQLKEISPQPNQHLIDVGTGSGILGITAALEYPEIKVELLDISQAALSVARANSRKHNVHLQLSEGNLLDSFEPAREPYFDIILANLPYVDKSWQRSPETNHEPEEALFADDGGLALIKKLILQAGKLLRPDGYLLLEADPRQFTDISNFAGKHQLKHYSQNGYCIVFKI